MEVAIGRPFGVGVVASRGGVGRDVRAALTLGRKGALDDGGSGF